MQEPAASTSLDGVIRGIQPVGRDAVDPLMGFTPVLKAFIATVVGGLGSLPGAVVGGLLLGAIEVTLQTLLPESLEPYRDAIVLLGVILILLARPEGVLPAPRARRS